MMWDLWHTDNTYIPSWYKDEIEKNHHSLPRNTTEDVTFQNRNYDQKWNEMKQLGVFIMYNKFSTKCVVHIKHEINIILKLLII